MNHSKWGLIILSTITLLSWGVRENAAAEDRPLTVGVILPLSGKAASVGTAIRNGMTMALDSLPAETRARMQITFEDDASETRQSVAAAQRLMQKDGIDVLTTALANAGNAVVPLTEQRGVPLLSFSIDRRVSAGKTNAFSFWVDIRAMAQAAVAEIDRRGYKHIASVTTVHEGNTAMRDAVIEAGSGKLAFAATRDVQLGETDLNSVILPLKGTPNIDSYALWMHPGHLGLFVRNLRAAGVSAPVFTLGGFEDTGVRSAAGPGLKGAWYATVDYSPQFLQSYFKRFPKDSSYGAAFGHDAILLLASAAEKGIRGNKLPEFFRTVSLTDVASRSVSGDGQNGFLFPVTIKIAGEDGIP